MGIVQEKDRIPKSSQSNYSDIGMGKDKCIFKKHNPYLMKKTSKKGKFSPRSNYFSIFKEEQLKFK